MFARERGHYPLLLWIYKLTLFFFDFHSLVVQNLDINVSVDEDEDDDEDEDEDEDVHVDAEDDRDHAEDDDLNVVAPDDSKTSALDGEITSDGSDAGTDQMDSAFAQSNTDCIAQDIVTEAKAQFGEIGVAFEVDFPKKSSARSKRIKSVLDNYGKSMEDLKEDPLYNELYKMRGQIGAVGVVDKIITFDDMLHGQKLPKAVDPNSTEFISSRRHLQAVLAMESKQNEPQEEEVEADQVDEGLFCFMFCKRLTDLLNVHLNILLVSHRG